MLHDLLVLWPVWLDPPVQEIHEEFNRSAYPKCLLQTTIISDIFAFCRFSIDLKEPVLSAAVYATIPTQTLL